MSRAFRPDTSRKPVVLNSTCFAKALQKLCREHEIYDSDGLMPSWSAINIRAEVGRSMFANGASAEDVAAKLGNTAVVSKMHYDKMYPEDEAAMRRTLYSQTLDDVIASKESKTTSPSPSPTPLYGACTLPTSCPSTQDCRKCTQLTTEKKKGRRYHQ